MNLKIWKNSIKYFQHNVQINSNLKHYRKCICMHIQTEHIVIFESFLNIFFSLLWTLRCATLLKTRRLAHFQKDLRFRIFFSFWIEERILLKFMWKLQILFKLQSFMSFKKIKNLKCEILFFEIILKILLNLLTKKF